jgi:hypothetical protein
VSTWEDDKRLTDPWMPMVKAICGVYVFNEAPFIEDRDHNTDLMTLVAGEIRIAVRLRSPQYWNKRYYPHEFTLRDSRPSGQPTEFDKILDDWGHYFFYGFRTESPPKLHGFGLLDLAKFRQWVKAYKARWGRYPGRGPIPNGDGSSTFRAWAWNTVPPDSILCMWPKKIALGTSLVPENIRASIQLALKLSQEQES